MNTIISYWIEVRRTGNNLHLLITQHSAEDKIPEFIKADSCIFKSFRIDEDIEANSQIINRLNGNSILFRESNEIQNGIITIERHSAEILSSCIDPNNDPTVNFDGNSGYPVSSETVLQYLQHRGKPISDWKADDDADMDAMLVYLVS